MRKLSVCAALACSILTSGCPSRPNVMHDEYSRTLLDMAVEFEARKDGVTKEHFLSFVDPVLFRLKDRSCVLFMPKPDVLGSQVAVCFNEKTGEVVEDFRS